MLETIPMIDTLRANDGLGIQITHPDQELAYKNLTDSEIMKHIIKSGSRGFVKMTKFRGATDLEVDGTPNLVLLKGREFLAQKLADVPQSSEVDQRNYKIRYFGYGRGGAQEGTGTVPNKMGPFDDDEGLYGPAHFATGSTGAESRYQYIHDGTLKNIRSDGRITIESETHTINKGTPEAGTSTETGTSLIVHKFTAIKYTMFINNHEFIKPSTAGSVGIDTNPFPFNEAALYAVEIQEVLNEDGVTYMEEPKGNTTLEKQKPNYLPFARFTTTTKWIEEGESLKLEWYILV